MHVSKIFVTLQRFAATNEISMIYRGEIYYGPEKKSLFVVYGTSENVGMALDMADTYIRMTRKYKYATCSHHPLLKYWWYQVTECFSNLFHKSDDSNVVEE